VARHRHDLVVVHAALDHHVDLDRPEADGMRRVDPGQHVGDREVDIVHALEDGVVERVERDGDAVRPASFSARALRASSEPLVVSVRSSGFPEGVGSSRSIADQVFEVLAQQRLAAGQADFLDAVGDEQPRHARDFLERQQVECGR
jgi:hypothetical protein